MAGAFRSHIINSREADNIANLRPVRVLGSCSFMYMRHGDVYILGVTKSNANVMMGFQFMTNVRTSASENGGVHHFISLSRWDAPVC